MLTPSDLIQIPYSPDLTQAGIACACRSLISVPDRLGGSHYDRLRQIVVGKAVELAFKRYLNWQQVPHDFLGMTPFTGPDQYDVAIGGRRCDIKHYLLTDKHRIRAVRQDPQLLLAAPALVPCNQSRPDPDRDSDLYIFAFLSSLFANGWSATQAAIQAGQPIYLIFAMPAAWARPRRWQARGPLVLKSSCQQHLKIELGGQAADRRFLSEQIMLSPGEPVSLSQDFYSVSYLHTAQVPDGAISLHSLRLDQHQIVAANQWGNIWIYGMDLILTGYLTRQAFQYRASRLPAGSRVFQYARTQNENLSLPMAELQPLTHLFQQAQAWRQHAKGENC